MNRSGKTTRRASSDVEEAILTATLEVLDEVGFRDLTVEAVAARSGAAKTAVYRRWPSKVPLVVDALTRLQPQPAVPDTGSLEGDLMELWKSLTSGGGRSIERIMPVVTAYLGSDDELMADLRDRFFEPRLRAMHILITRAAERGEIRADIDPSLAFDLLFGALAYRWLRGSPPDGHTTSALISLALEGLLGPGMRA